jgi:hypothetical protein
VDWCDTEAPEEKYDSRTLFERLKEQKDKKQEEFEESRKLKHLIRGLDNDEVSFLEQVDENKWKEEEQKMKEEDDAIREYQRQMSHLNEAEQTKKMDAFKKSLFAKSSALQSGSGATGSANRSSTRNKQANLLMNAVKVKKDGDKNADQQSSGRPNKRKLPEEGNGNGDKNGDDDKDEDESREQQLKLAEETSQLLQPATKLLGVLPGLASYCTDTSDSDEAESDENDEVNSAEVDPFFVCLKGRQIGKSVKKAKKMRKACSQ